jgi:hypothetical protein
MLIGNKQQFPISHRYVDLQSILLYDEYTKESSLIEKKENNRSLPGRSCFLFQKPNFRIGNHRFSQGGPHG